MKKKHTTLGASVVAWRLRTALNYSSVHRFATELEKVATAYPISLRSIDATVFADGFLKALKDGDGNTASRIAWTLKHRTPEGASDAQERIFVRHVFDNVLKEPLYWGEEEALLGLVASKYPGSAGYAPCGRASLREALAGESWQSTRTGWSDVETRKVRTHGALRKIGLRSAQRLSFALSVIHIGSSTAVLELFFLQRVLVSYRMAEMRIVSWNVNGIRAVHRKGLFLPFLKELKPDIICLQETKAEQHQSEIDLPKYEEFWHSAEKKGYSGTAIFTKTTPKNVLFGLPEDLAHKYQLNTDGYGNPNTEGRVIAADMGEIYVVSVYTPNAKDDLSRLPLRHKQWDPAFLEYMKRLQDEKPVVFCGDLNVAHTEDDLARPKENNGVKGFTLEEREGIDNIIAGGFVDTFRMFTKGNGHYTWWSHWGKARERNVGWRIDYIFISKKLITKVKHADIHPDILGSDHCPVSVTF